MLRFRPIYIEDIQNTWCAYNIFIGLTGAYCFHMSWLYFSQYSLIFFLFMMYAAYQYGMEWFVPKLMQFRYKYTRAMNYSLLIPYDDVWETRATALSQQYYDYYTYIWRNWHEMEERILIILSLRCIIFGI